MKNTTVLKTTMLLVSLVFVVGVPASMAETVALKSIRHVIKQYEGFLNAGDTQSIMKLYAKSPIFMPQHSPAQASRIAVKKAYESVFATIDLNIKFTIYEVEIYGNTAWARTSSTGKTIILANGVKINEGNNELFIFRKERGAWKIHRYLFSTTTPRLNPKK